MSWKKEKWKSLKLNRKEKKERNEDRLRDLQDNIRHINTYDVGAWKENREGQKIYLKT